uniref:Secondary thiamine-phosphate synthase enzyme n=1 Tax=Trichuris muris TaxID=70415 RepID=A0A5S6QPA9_TRIMR
MSVAQGCKWIQKVIKLKSRARGCHLITEDVENALPELREFSIGVLHLCLQHTSASISLNENWDNNVRVDAEMMLNHLVPENMPYRHTCEGPDDMPAHVKSALVGATLCIPITNGRLNLGGWQGIWLCEHRNIGGSRKIVATIQGSEN